MLPATIHALVSVALIVAYLVVTVQGFDGTPLLGVLGGYIGGGAVQGAVQRGTVG